LSYPEGLQPSFSSGLYSAGIREKFIR
jgi:hypothetical protein